MQPITPDAHGIAVLLLTVVALFLFTRDNIPLESSSLAILILLVAGFELVPYTKNGEEVIGTVDFFAGFGGGGIGGHCHRYAEGHGRGCRGPRGPCRGLLRRWRTRGSWTPGGG